MGGRGARPQSKKLSATASAISLPVSCPPEPFESPRSNVPRIPEGSLSGRGQRLISGLLTVPCLLAIQVASLTVPSKEILELS